MIEAESTQQPPKRKRGRPKGSTNYDTEKLPRLPKRKADPKYIRNEDHKEAAFTMASYGVPQTTIERVLGIAMNTLRKHYPCELHDAAHRANATVVKGLFENAKSGNVAAQIYWTKTRMGWREPRSVGDPSDPPLIIEHIVKWQD